MYRWKPCGLVNRLIMNAVSFPSRTDRFPFHSNTHTRTRHGREKHFLEKHGYAPWLRLLLLIHRVSYVCVCYWVQTDNVIARLLPPTLPCRIVHNNKVCVEWILCCSHSRLWWPSTRRTATNLMTTRSLIDFPPSRRVVTLLSTLK